MTEPQPRDRARKNVSLMATSRYQGVWLWADLDGTLLNPERQLDAENLRALAFFHAHGGRFGVATGRSEHSLATNFPELKLTLPGIFYNGALIQWHPDGTIVRTSRLSSEPVPLLEALRQHCPEVGIEVLCSGKAWMVHRSASLEDQMRREGLVGVDAALSEIPPGWFKVLLGGSPDVLSRAGAFLKAHMEDRYALVHSEQTLLEILEPGVSKGDAIAYFLNMQPVAAGDEKPLLVTVGDNDNDVDMLAMADLAIAMKDGSESARAVAHAVIPSNRVPCMPRVLAVLDRKLETRLDG